MLLPRQEEREAGAEGLEAAQAVLEKEQQQQEQQQKKQFSDRMSQRMKIHDVEMVDIKMKTQHLKQMKKLALFAFLMLTPFILFAQEEAPEEPKDGWSNMTNCCVWICYFSR